MTVANCALPDPDTPQLDARALQRNSAVTLHRRMRAGRHEAIFKNGTLATYRIASTAVADLWLACDEAMLVDALYGRAKERGLASDRPDFDALLLVLVAHGAVTYGEEGAGSASPGPPAQRGFLERCGRLLTSRIELRGMDRAMGRLYAAGGFLLFTGPFLAALAVFNLTALVVLAMRGTPTLDVAPVDLAVLPALGAITLLCHELAHALAVKRFGRDVIGVGLGWFWFSPVLYVNTSDMWLGTRAERIAVSLAGPVTDVSIASAVCLVSTVTTGHAAAFCAAVSMTLYLSGLFNLTPFLEYDGYYILSDLLDRPFLRRDALAILTRLVEVARGRVERVFDPELARTDVVARMAFLTGWLVFMPVMFAILTPHLYAMLASHVGPPVLGQVLAVAAVLGGAGLLCCGIADEVLRSARKA